MDAQSLTLTRFFFVLLIGLGTNQYFLHEYFNDTWFAVPRAE